MPGEHSTAEAICIDPARASEVLPFARDFIASAASHCGDWTEAEICEGVQSGALLLWVTLSTEGLTAAAVTRLKKTRDGLICEVVVCGGLSGNWNARLASIERYATNEGCARMRIEGRPGWARVLSGYRTELITLSKKLK